MSEGADTPGLETADAQELRRLRSRVAELEAELVDVHSWANRTVAQAQEQAYWLERWNFDLNGLMRSPWATRARAVARAVRKVYRALKRLKRRLLSK